MRSEPALMRVPRAPVLMLKPLALLVLLALGGCAATVPEPLAESELQRTNQSDRSAMRKDVEPLAGPLTLDEALARALKYNLERRVRMMEEALAFNQLDVARFDMLPKLVAQAGYTTRSNDRINNSRDAVTGAPSTSRFISSDRNHSIAELGLTWSLLDYGLGYYGARQQASRLEIASEKRRKAMHVLMQDVRTAYWRAASAQKLRAEVSKTIAMAEEALGDARKVESEGLRNPLDSLRYQRQVLENMRLLEAIEQELSSAQVELATLINAPLGQPLLVAEPDAGAVKDAVLSIPLAQLEETALAQNPDLREQHHNARIARDETRKTLLRLFPNVSFNYALKYDSDSYLVNRDWSEAGLQISFNLFNLLTADSQLKLAEAGVKVADQRRMATQLAVMTQVHLARLQLLNARNQYDRAQAIYDTDRKIVEHVRNRETVRAQSKLERVSQETAHILSLLRRYQALAQAQVAENRLLANLGLEPQIGSTGELTLAQLSEQLRQDANPWARLQAPAPAPAPAPVSAPASTSQATPVTEPAPAPVQAEAAPVPLQPVTAGVRP